MIFLLRRERKNITETFFKVPRREQKEIQKGTQINKAALVLLR